MTRPQSWRQMLGSKLPASPSFDPRDKPYVGLQTPDTDGEPAGDALKTQPSTCLHRLDEP